MTIIWLTLGVIVLVASAYLYGVHVARLHYVPLLQEAWLEGVDAGIREAKYS